MANVLGEIETMIGGSSWSGLDLGAATQVVDDQGTVAQAAAMVAQPDAAISGAHQIVKVGHTLCADRRQGNGAHAIVH